MTDRRSVGTDIGDGERPRDATVEHSLALRHLVDGTQSERYALLLGVPIYAPMRTSTGITSRGAVSLVQPASCRWVM